MSRSPYLEGTETVIPDANKGTTPKAVRRVPKGTSEYQAAWIVDESDEDDIEEEGSSDGAAMNDSADEEEEMVELADDVEMATDGRKSVAFEDFEDFDMDEEDQQQVARYFISLLP